MADLKKVAAARSVEYLVRWLTTLGGINAAETEEWLNWMADQGWRLIAVDNGRGYFEREKRDDE